MNRRPGNDIRRRSLGGYRGWVLLGGIQKQWDFREPKRAHRRENSLLRFCGRKREEQTAKEGGGGGGKAKLMKTSVSEQSSSPMSERDKGVLISSLCMSPKTREGDQELR